MGRRSNPTPQMQLSVNQLTEAFGLDRATVRKRLQAADAPHKSGPRGAKLYKLQDAIKACLVDFIGADQPGTYEEARTREMKARALKQELEVATMRAQLLLAAEVAQVWAEYIGKANTKLGAMSASLAPLLASMTDEAEIKALIDAAIDEVRAELAGDAEDAEEGDDALDADAGVDGERVGGPASTLEPGGERGAGAVDDRP